MRCWDSKPRPPEHESPPITTRPGLPPKLTFKHLLHKSTQSWLARNDENIFFLSKKTRNCREEKTLNWKRAKSRCLPFCHFLASRHKSPVRNRLHWMCLFGFGKKKRRKKPKWSLGKNKHFLWVQKLVHTTKGSLPAPRGLAYVVPRWMRTRGLLVQK